MAERMEERVWSAEDFLAWESQQPARHELIDNRIYPMAGASRWHNRINFNLAFCLMPRLRDQGCQVFGMDMRVQVSATGSFVYPDMVVVCGEPRFRIDVEQDTILNPSLLFEILSASTEAIDRDRKLRQYLDIPSLQGYFLVSQTEPLIEAFARQGDEWLYRKRAGLDASLVIEEPACELPLQDVYEEVTFAAAQ